MAYQVLILIVPFITSPYVSRVLGPEGIGTYSVTTSIAKYFSMFAALGMSNYVNRLISKARDNHDNLSITFCNLFYFQALTSSLCILLYIFYYLLVGRGNYGVVSLCQTPYVLAAFFEISWFFYGLENFKFMVIRNAIVKIATAICVFIFVKEASDLWIYVLINSLSLLIGQLSMWPFLLKKVYWSKPQWRLIRQHFKPNIILLVSVVAVSIYTILDKIMIESLSSTAEVGYYENSEKLFNLGCSLVGSVGLVLLPRMTYLTEVNDLKNIDSVLKSSTKYLLALAFALSFGLIGVADPLCVIFFGQEFANSGAVLSALSVAIIFYTWSNILRTEYLLPIGEDKIFVKGTVFAAIINVVANYLLIPSYGAVGAAIGTVMAQFTEALYQSFWVRKRIPILKYLKKVIPFFIVSLIMCLICRVIGTIMGTSLKALIIQIVLGGFIYIFSSIAILNKQNDKLIKNALKSQRH